jgi:hypothetical protein
MLVAFMITIEQYKLNFEMESAYMCLVTRMPAYLYAMYVTQEIAIYFLLCRVLSRKL